MKSSRLFTWAGLAFAILIFVGFVWMAKFIVPPGPSASPEAVAKFYQGNAAGIRTGMVICVAATALLGLWGCGLAARIGRPRTEPSVLLSVQLVFLTAMLVTMFSAFTTFSVIAFQPSDLSAETVRMLNDIGWFQLLFPWTTGGMWVIAVGLAILECRDEFFPRWSGYFSILVGLAFAPGGLIVYFKSGMLAFNGLYALYMPLSAFIIWIAVMTALMYQKPGGGTDAATPTPSAGSTQAAPDPALRGGNRPGPTDG